MKHFFEKKNKTKNNSVHSTYYEIISRYLFGLRSNKFTRACVTRAKCFFCAYSLLLQLIRFKIECHPRNVHLKLVHSHESFCFFICIHTEWKGEIQHWLKIVIIYLAFDPQCVSFWFIIISIKLVLFFAEKIELFYKCSGPTMNEHAQT